jgi:hypothetical protein
MISNTSRLSTHELFAARTALKNIRRGELLAKKAVDEMRIEGLFLALAGMSPGFQRRQFEAGISAAFARRETTVSELRALSA